jgi:hypothetical protein
MRKIEMTFGCQFCKERTKARFAKPSFVAYSTFNLKCDGCESEFSVKVRRKRGVDGTQAEYQMTPTKLTAKARLILQNPMIQHMKDENPFKKAAK